MEHCGVGVDLSSDDAELADPCMHTLREGLRSAPVWFAGAAASTPVQQGAEVFVRDGSGRYRSVGKVRVVDGDIGLVMLRLAKVMPAIDAGRPLYVGTSGSGEGSKEEGGAQSYAEVEVWRPDWWPEQWGREEQQAAGGGGED